MLDEEIQLEARLFNTLIQTVEWKALKRKIDGLYQENYRKLKKCRRDTAFYKIQGYLEAIDDIYKTLNQSILDAQYEED